MEADVSQVRNQMAANWINTFSSAALCWTKSSTSERLSWLKLGPQPPAKKQAFAWLVKKTKRTPQTNKNQKGNQFWGRNELNPNWWFQRIFSINFSPFNQLPPLLGGLERCGVPGWVPIYPQETIQAAPGIDEALLRWSWSEPSG